MSGLTPRKGLVRLLLIKSFADLFFVLALAVSFSFRTFEPRFRGNVDEADALHVAGWAINAADPSSRVEVHLYIDGHFIANTRTGRSRPDVVAAKRVKEAQSGFEFRLPPLDPGEHEARVYVVHRSADNARLTLQLLGRPITFRVGENPVENGSRGGSEVRGGQ